MKQRSPPSLQFLVVAAAAAPTDTIIISSRPRHTAGRNQWRRGYSGGNSGDKSATELNQSSRSDNHNKFRPQTRSPPSFNPNAPPYNPNQQFRPPPFYQNQNQQFRPPPFYQNQNQQFRPPPLQQNQQLRPRPAKPLDYRNWEFAIPGPPPDCERFTVLSYNILADYLAINHRSKLYYHIPRHILDWEFRRRSIIFELGLWSADILCFQEVDRFQDLEMDLKVRGYTGIWKMRTGDPVDGCAIFWRVSRFKVLHEESIEFSKLGLRDNVAQICVFESLNQSLDHKRSTSCPSESAAGHKKVVICNIHVLYNPKRGEIKLGQVRILLERAYAVSRLWDNAPVVLCGDFNCTPQSPLYTFISEQKLNFSELPRDKLSGQASAEIRPQWTTSPNLRGPPGNSPARAPSTVEPKTEVHQGKDVSKDETGSTRCVPVTAHNEQTISSQTEAGFSVSQLKGEVSEDSPPNSHQEDIQENDRSADLLHEIPSLNVLEVSYHENSRSGSLDNDCADILYASTSAAECETMENLSLNEPVESTEGDGILGENCDTFLSELHNEDEIEVSNELLSSPQQLESSPEPFCVERHTYDHSAWTPMEIEKATGSSECSLIEHPLKLRSTYSQVENPSGTRDANGEPLVTSYNRCFLGTVDYVWCSQGLQTVRVLAPIPRHAMQWTPGFPTKKWGSDHIALVSELAFTKDVNLENAGE